MNPVLCRCPPGLTAKMERLLLALAACLIALPPAFADETRWETAWEFGTWSLRERKNPFTDEQECIVIHDDGKTQLSGKWMLISSAKVKSYTFRFDSDPSVTRDASAAEEAAGVIAFQHGDFQRALTASRVRIEAVAQTGERTYREIAFRDTKIMADRSVIHCGDR